MPEGRGIVTPAEEVSDTLKLRYAAQFSRRFWNVDLAASATTCRVVSGDTSNSQVNSHSLMTRAPGFGRFLSHQPIATFFSRPLLAISLKVPRVSNT
jgi:hypothetical protein